MDSYSVFVLGSQDGSVKVWSMKDGQLMVSVTGLGDDVEIIKCCNEDKHIIASSRRGLTVLDFDTGEILRRYVVYGDKEREELYSSVTLACARTCQTALRDFFN